MKKTAFALVAIVTMACASGSALAQGRGGNGHGGSGHGAWHGGSGHFGGGHGGFHGPRVGVFFGFPGYWGAWPYPFAYPYAAYYPYSAYPYPVYAPAEPTVYMQSAPDGGPAPAATNYWYYCAEPAGYYPYVQNCSREWMQVVPQRGPNAPALAPAQ